MHVHCKDVVNKITLTLIHTTRLLLSKQPAHTLRLLYINIVNNRYNIIGSVIWHMCGSTHDTRFPPFLPTKIKKKELSLHERLINTQSHFQCSYDKTKSSNCQRHKCQRQSKNNRRPKCKTKTKCLDLLRLS